jgi:hypothetical protein
MAKPIAYIFLRSHADEWLNEIQALRADLANQDYSEWQLLAMECFWTLDLIRGSIIQSLQ